MPLIVISQIIQQLKEKNLTVLTQATENNPTDQENRILETLGLKGIQAYDHKRKEPQIHEIIMTWSPHTPEFLKLNFNGSLNGNPCRVGVGTIICDNVVRILNLYFTHLGVTTKNVVAFHVFEQGLEVLVLAKNHYYTIYLENHCNNIGENHLVRTLMQLLFRLVWWLRLEIMGPVSQ